MRGRSAACIGLLYGGMLFAAPFDRSHWKFRASAAVRESGRLCSVPFDRELYARMRQDLGDLRVIRDGEEIPYVIDTLAGQSGRSIIDTITPERSEDAEARASILILDLRQSGLPHDRVRLEPDDSEFHRTAELEASDDAKTWRLVTRGAIFQVAAEKSLGISYSERRDRYLRLRIFNGDDKPVPVSRVHVETLKRIVRFLPSSAGPLWLYFGNPDARPPVYDLAALLSRRPPLPETMLVAGEWEINPDYRPSSAPLKPWSERHPALLYGVLGVALMGMGFVTLRFLFNVRNK